MGKILSRSLTIFLLVVMAVSCNNNGCLDNQSSIPQAGFYSYETLKSVAITKLSVGGIGAPDDSLLLKNSTASSVYLPFRSEAGKSSFYFLYGEEALAQYDIVDTITFFYDSQPYFASEECGAMFRYRITGVKHTNWVIDSVGISDSLVTNVPLETIGIYFRTSTPDQPSTTE